MSKDVSRCRLKKLLDGASSGRRQFVEVTGFSVRQYQKWFGAGVEKSFPNEENLEKLCRIYNWDKHWILTGQTPEDEELREVLTALKINQHALSEIIEKLDRVLRRL